MNDLNKLSCVIYGLTYHYVGFAEMMSITRSQVSPLLQKGFERFDTGAPFNSFDLMGSYDHNIEIMDIAKMLTSVVANQLNAANTDKVCHSITGGFDSRILLSILLKLGVEIHGYTYGNPKARDCLVAKELAQKCGVSHIVHDIRFDKDSFRIAAEDSIRSGDFVCSLHRAHRVEAIKRESVYADTMFLGTMGGEFVKGANHEDYIVSNFVYEYAQNQNLDTVKKYMGIRGLKPNDDIAREVKKIMDEQIYIRDSENIEFHALIEIAARLHHGQNLIQYPKYIPNVFTPYCDPEYMKLLFSSKYNFLHRRKTQSTSKYKLENPRFGSMMQHYLNPALAKIPYSNGFSASEYLVSPYWAALKAKQRKRKLKSPPNFPLGKWMEDYVKEMLNEIKEAGSDVCEVYDIPLLIKELDRPNLPQTEQFWLKYTCPIQMYLTDKLIGEIQ